MILQLTENKHLDLPTNFYFKFKQNKFAYYNLLLFKLLIVYHHFVNILTYNTLNLILK